MIENHTIEISTRGVNEIVDITSQVQDILSSSEKRRGSVLIFVPGSTGALSTIEYEPGLIKDLPIFLENLVGQSNAACFTCAVAVLL